ncbi:unnamed protein product [Nezara viridula]|uniref:C2H2-type domain-containing protein n=2 Tax=Nezara viridula TaxID=85310 RepID=A0A9P0H3Q5_NEZVI|nr:unnamed protein product [Nezara viridula]
MLISFMKMKEEIKTEELIYEDEQDMMAFDDGMQEGELAVLPEDIPETKYQMPEEEQDSMSMLPHLGEVIWLKSELTDVTLDKEPELDDPMSFGYFEEQGQDRRESYFLSEGNKLGDSKFTCFYCGNESNCLKKLRAHIKTTHTGPKRISDQSKIYEAIIIYSCRYCDYRTNDNSLYSNHLRKHLAEIPVTKKLICSKELKICNHQFKIKHRFRCPYCSFKTSDNERIRQHMCSCHENQRPYHYLRERTRPHEGRQFVYHPCPECRYCAGRSGTLRRHIMAKHTNERPYHCTECNYQATQNETLRRHVLARHTKEKPHHCPRCTYSAVQLGTLKYHVKSKHNLL